MPIRINLLAEDQELEERRRKNPVKRAVWLGGFVIFLVLLWGLTLFLKITVARSELTATESKWKEMEKEVKQVAENRRQSAELERKLSALAQYTTNRFLWANTLDALQQTLVENVQLLRFKAEQTYAFNEPAKPPVGPGALPGGPPLPGGPAPAAAAAKPATASERIVVHLEGRDAGARPGDQVPRYKETLLNSPYFQAHLQKTNSILLTSLSAPQTGAVQRASYVNFGLQLNLQEKERRLYD
jgi:hypothetical protein